MSEARGLLPAALALLLALCVAFAAGRPPAALPESAPEAEFSAGRAMADVRAIAAEPRPTGTEASRRAIAYLADRLASLGTDPVATPFPLPPAALDRRGRWGLAGDPRGTNLVGILRGARPDLPAVLLVAHHDSWGGSPGAADDGAGVAAALEVVRALRAGGPLARDVGVVLTDAEELGLVGAEAFYAADPLARRAGAVVNLDARGGGGRVMMYETSRPDDALIQIYRRAVRQPATSSLAIFVYRLMPNRTDLTVALSHGIPGYNLAFIGDPAAYHTPLSTPDRLDPGTLQHLGAQALDLVRALGSDPEPLEPAGDLVFGDVLGLTVLAWRPVTGWLVLALAAGLLGVAGDRSRAAVRGVLGGMVAGLGAAALTALGATVAAALIAGRADYYGRMAATPDVEGAALLVGVFALAAAVSGGGWALARALALPAAGIGWIAGGPGGLLAGLALASLALGALAPRTRRAGMGLGPGMVALALSLAAQLAAPEASPPVVWPAIAAGAVGILAAHRRTLPAAVAVAGVAAGQGLCVAHLAFLGLGPDLPAVAGASALLLAAALGPLLPAGAARVEPPADGDPTDARPPQPSTSVNSALVLRRDADS